MQPAAPSVKDVVLVGAGHSHVQVLRRFGMRPEPGLRLTVIAREVHTPYSGMLPGHVAGVYSWEELHVDVARLARFADARLVASEVTGLDLADKRVRLADRPALRYDILSLNTGGVPGGDLPDLPNVTPVKPIGRFPAPVERGVRGTAPALDAAIAGGRRTGQRGACPGHAGAVPGHGTMRTGDGGRRTADGARAGGAAPAGANSLERRGRRRHGLPRDDRGQRAGLGGGRTRLGPTSTSSGLPVSRRSGGSAPVASRPTQGGSWRSMRRCGPRRIRMCSRPATRRP